MSDQEFIITFAQGLEEIHLVLELLASLKAFLG